jgi:hypothetical protein
VSVEIRSYRAVFDLERRIYRIDRLRLNPSGVPVRGVVYCLAILAALALVATLPLLGAAAKELPWYLRDLVLPVGSAAVLTMIRVEGRPFHLAAAALLRHAVGPRELAGLLRRADGSRQLAGLLRRADGSRQLAGLLGHTDGTRQLAGLSADPRSARAPAARGWRPAELLMLPDGSEPRLRRLRYIGPGAVLVAVAHERVGRRCGAIGAGRPHLRLRELADKPKPAAGVVIALERGVRLRVR